MFPINKFKKIAILSVSVLILLGGGVFFLLSLSSVQTKFAKRITQSVNKSFNTDISIEKASINMNGDVLVSNILIQDHHKDSLLFVKELKTSLNGLERFMNRDYNFNSIGLDGVRLFLTQYKGETKSSLQHFIAKLRDTISRERVPFSFQSKILELKTSELVSEDMNELNSKKSFSNIDLVLKDFNFDSNVLSLAINSLKASSSQYGDIENLTANVRYTSDSLITNRFALETNRNEIRGSGSIAFLSGNFANLEPSLFEIKLDESTIQLSKIKVLEPYIKEDLSVRLNLFARGSLQDFEVKIDVKGRFKSLLSGFVRVINVFEKDKASYRSKNFKIRTSDTALRELFNQNIYNQISTYSNNVGILSVDSNFHGSQNNWDIQLKSTSNIGEFTPNVFLNRTSKTSPWNYKINLGIKNFDLGRLLNRKTITRASAKVNFNGVLEDNSDVINASDGLIKTLQIGSRTLNNIKFNSSQNAGITRGVFKSSESNHDFVMDFEFDFSKNMFDASGFLKTINLSEFELAEGSSNVVLSSAIQVHSVTKSDTESSFELQLGAPMISSNEKAIQFDDLNLKTETKKLFHTILIQDSDAINLFVEGAFKYKNLSTLLVGLADNFLVTKQAQITNPKESFNFDILLKTKLTESLFPSLSTPDDFFLSGIISSNVKESVVVFDLPILLFKNYRFKGLHFESDSSNSIYTSFLSADEIRIGSFSANELFMISSPINDKNQIRIEGVLNNNKLNTFETNLSYSLEDNLTKFNISKFRLNNSNGAWTLLADKKNQIVFNSLSNTLSLNPVSLVNEDQKFEFVGNYKSKKEFDFQVNSYNVALGDVLPTSLNYEIQANLNSAISFYKTTSQNDASLEVKMSGLVVNDIQMGDFNFNISGNTSLDSYKTEALLVKDGIENLSMGGGILVHQQRTTLDLDIKLNEFDMSFFSRLGKGKMTNITSLLTGDFNLWGPTDNLAHSGKLSLDEFNMTIPFTNMSYGLDQATQLTLYDQVIKFETTSFFDQTQGTTSKLKGTLSHVSFNDWNIDLDINSNRLLLMNRENERGSLFYGTGFLDGNIHIHGPTKNLIIDVDGATAKGTSIIIPWEENKSLADISFIDFISKAELNRPAVEIEEEETKEITISRGLEMTFNLDINNNAEVEIVVDQVSGSTLTGRGSGNILMETNIEGKFNMWGDFIAYDGIYNFKNFGLIDKKFNVNPGGTIVWEGNPLEAQMNIEAVYEVPGGANPALLVDNPNFNKKIPTNVLIKLEGSLLKPDNPMFEINFPNTSGIVASEINYRLADQQRRQLQAISLLSQGIFVSDVSFSTQGIANNLYEKASDMLSSILGESDGKLDFGLNYLKGDSRPDLDIRSQDRIGITFVTQISDKVLLNGKIGVPVGGVEETLIVGDVQIDFILNEEGTLRAKVFNKENEFRYISDDLGYTQGVGLTYQVDFKTFEGLIQKIISKNK